MLSNVRLVSSCKHEIIENEGCLIFSTYLHYISMAGVDTMNVLLADKMAVGTIRNVKLDLLFSAFS